MRPDAKDHSKVDSSKAGSSQQQKKAPQTVKTMKASVNSVSTGVLGIIHILRNQFFRVGVIKGPKRSKRDPKEVQEMSNKFQKNVKTVYIGQKCSILFKKGGKSRNKFVSALDLISSIWCL